MVSTLNKAAVNNHFGKYCLCHYIIIHEQEPELFDILRTLQAEDKAGCMIRYTGVNHLAMVTGDMDSTIRYWRDLLGMRLIAGLGEPGYRHYFFEISENDMVAFFEWPDVSPIEEKEHGRRVSGRVAFDHVSFGVESKEMLLELKDRIDAAGYWVSEVIDHGFIHSVYTFDPNGIPIEFSWNISGVNIHLNPAMLDADPSDISQGGAGPQPGIWPVVQRPTPLSEYRAYPGQGSQFFRGKKKT
jgi:catechol 2,3-dioxygenase-like lactoylglutathione lyase family enzyme